MTSLLVNRWLDANGVAVNNIVQSQVSFYSTYQSFTNGSANNTGLYISLAPRYATSKILILCSANISHASTSTVCRARIARTGPSTSYSTGSSPASSAGWTTTNYNGQTSSVPTMFPNFNMQWFDTPNSTASCTYTLQISTNNASYTVYLNGNGDWGSGWAGSSTMIALEVAQ